MFTNNPAYRGLGPSQLAWMVTTTRMGHYMPLTWLTFGATYVAAGMDPWAYHLGSLLLHALDAALVTGLAWGLIARASGAPAAPVAPTAAGAAMAGLAIGVDGALRWRPWGILALLSMAAALLSKEIAVTLPAVLLVLDAYPLRRPVGWARRLGEKWPFVALAVAGAVMALLARSAGARF